MKVACYVNAAFTDGVGRHSREMVAGLAACQGIDCQVFASGRDLDRNADLSEALKSVPVNRIPLSSQNLERSWKLLGWPPVRWFVKGPADIVYSPGATRLPRTGAPTVITVHDVQAFETDLPWSGTTEHRLFRAKWGRWLPKAIEESALVLTVSEFSKQRMCELLAVPPEKIGVVGNGVSQVFFDAGRDRKGEVRPCVTVVGGLRTKKGAEDVVAVAKALASEASPLTIHVVGTNEPRWEAAARRLPNIVLHGRLQDGATADLLATSTALLCLSHYEGFGLPVVEAMATGTVPVVCSDASLPEICDDAGVVLPDRDPRSLAAILAQLYTDSCERTRLVEKALARAQSFTWASCVARLNDNLSCVIQ